MGMVLEAINTATGATVALKLISGDVDAEMLARFQREVRAAAAVDSPHIVRIFDTGTDAASGSPYMVMERLVGDDVSAIARRDGALDPPMAVRIVAQAAVGLGRAHRAGIVHRDIKPANLFLADGELGEATVKFSTSAWPSCRRT